LSFGVFPALMFSCMHRPVAPTQLNGSGERSTPQSAYYRAFVIRTSVLCSQ
jgi:hypothetical protein